LGNEPSGDLLRSNFQKKLFHEFEVSITTSYKINKIVAPSFIEGELKIFSYFNV
jgi:hypothetical protein